MSYPKILINNDMVRNRPRSKFFMNFPLGINAHWVSQSVLRRPRRCLFIIFFDANSKNLQPLIPESLPNLFFNNRSLLLAACSKGFPEN